MLVPTMTPEEIYAEMYKDSAWLQDRIADKIYPSIQKMIKRRSLFPFFHVTSVKSAKTHIEYNVAFFAYSRGDWNRPYCVIYTKYTHESGKTLVYIEHNRFAIRIYTPHFMQRFKERQNEYVSDNETLANIDLELLFIARNWEVKEMDLLKSFAEESQNQKLSQKFEEISSWSKFKQDSDYERYTVACLLGMCLCERNKKHPDISIFDTFVTPDLFKFNQWIDFVPAYSHVVLNTLTRVYPRQKEHIVKEWNNSINECPDDGDPLKYMLDKVDELMSRYPVPQLF